MFSKRKLSLTLLLPLTASMAQAFLNPTFANGPFGVKGDSMTFQADGWKFDNGFKAGALSNSFGHTGTFGEARGYADLRTGKIGVIASGTNAASQSTVSAGFWDTIWLTNVTGQTQTTTLRLVIDGVITGQGSATFSWWLPNMNQPQVRSLSSGDNVFDLTLTTPTGGSKHEVEFGMGAYVTSFGKADFMQTLRLEILTPEGVSAVRSSTPVPEPATLAALGLGVLGVARRRRNRRA